jgi:hypothetical protein
MPRKSLRTLVEGAYKNSVSIQRHHDKGRNGVPESMKVAPRNIERVEDWPKPVFYDVVARWRPVVSGSKPPTLGVSGPDRSVFPQNVCERIRQSHRRCTGPCSLWIELFRTTQSGGRECTCDGRRFWNIKGWGATSWFLAALTPYCSGCLQRAVSSRLWHYFGTTPEGDFLWLKQ